jgi:hypothetical protein
MGLVCEKLINCKNNSYLMNRDMKCVMRDCDNKSVGICNNCRIPVCTIHSRKVNNKFYLCINCYEYAKKMGARF